MQVVATTYAIRQARHQLYIVTTNIATPNFFYRRDVLSCCLTNNVRALNGKISHSMDLLTLSSSGFLLPCIPWKEGCKPLSALQHQYHIIVTVNEPTVLHRKCYNAAPGLKRTIARRQPSSVLSISISRIFDTSSVRIRSNIGPMPTWWAVLRYTWRPVASTMLSLDATDWCEKLAISNSFQPGTIHTRLGNNLIHDFMAVTQFLWKWALSMKNAPSVGFCTQRAWV